MSRPDEENFRRVARLLADEGREMTPDQVRECYDRVIDTLLASMRLYGSEVTREDVEHLIQLRYTLMDEAERVLTEMIDEHGEVDLAIAAKCIYKSFHKFGMMMTYIIETAKLMQKGGRFVLTGRGKLRRA